MRRTSTTAAALLLVSTFGVSPAAAQFRHHPPQEAIDASDPVLACDVEHPEPAGEGRVLYRPRGSDAEPDVAVIERSPAGWTARLDSARLDPARGVDYWVVARAEDGTETPVFASADAPHPA